MQCDIFSGENKVGAIRGEQQGLYSKFYGTLDSKAVSKVYCVFEGGTYPMGIPVPENGKMVLRVSVPTAKLPGGRLLSAYVKENHDGWLRFAGGELDGVTFPVGLRKGDRLRFTWEPGRPVPAEEAIIFYSYVQEQGSSYLELTLNDDGTLQI